MRPSQLLVDPLSVIRRLGADVTLVVEPGGNKAVALHLPTNLRSNDVLRAKRYFETYRKLLLLQLDVPEGGRPRTVQQLVAFGVVKVRGGKYVMVGVDCQIRKF